MEISQFEEVLMPKAIAPNPEENVRIVRDMEYKEGDIIICTYPKCGSHWVESLVRCLLRKDKDEDILSKSSLIDLYPPDLIASMPSPRIMFTHLWPNRLPLAHVRNAGKLILILRNPKDIAVSSYYHFKKSIVLRSTHTWDQHLEAYMNGNTAFGNIFTYLENWQKALREENLNLKYFYYEDLKTKPLDTLESIAKHVRVTKTRAELQSILDECSLGSLKSKVDVDKVPLGLKDANNQMIIYRKGEIGDWKNHFTVAQNELFDKLLEEKMKNSMFEFKYE